MSTSFRGPFTKTSNIRVCQNMKLQNDNATTVNLNSILISLTSALFSLNSTQVSLNRTLVSLNSTHFAISCLKHTSNIIEYLLEVWGLPVLGKSGVSSANGY